MTHAPKFWANKLPIELQGKFWGLIEYGFSGETAYNRVMAEIEPSPMDFPDDLFADVLDQVKPHMSSWTDEELARYSRVTGQA